MIRYEVVGLIPVGIVHDLHSFTREANARWLGRQTFPIPVVEDETTIEVGSCVAVSQDADGSLTGIVELDRELRNTEKVCLLWYCTGGVQCPEVDTLQSFFLGLAASYPRTQQLIRQL